MATRTLSPKSVKSVQDGLKNILTGLGIAGKDKRMAGEFYAEYLSETELEEIYAASDVAQTFIDELADDMTREGFTVLIDGSDENDEVIQEEIQRLDWTEKSNYAVKMSRLYGMSCIYVLTDGDQKKALGKTIPKISGLQVLTKRDLRFSTVDKDPASPNYGYPLLYDFNGLLIHYTRMIRFDGKLLPYHSFINNSRCHDSYLCAFKNPLRNYTAAFDSASTILQDFVVPVVKMSKLNELLQAGQESLVKERVRMVQKSLSPVNAVIVAEGEEYDRMSADVTGLHEILDRMENRMVSASKMPHTMILGTGPGGGLKANGESEKRDWYDRVKAQQISWYQRRVIQMLKLIFSQTNPSVLKGVSPKTLKIKFNPLWQMSDAERAELNNVQSQADERNIKNQIVTPEEVAESRFGGEFSLETTIDTSLRRNFSAPDDIEDDQKADGLKRKKKPKWRNYKEK